MTVSSRLTAARPVRTVASFRRKSSITPSMRGLVSLMTSFSFIRWTLEMRLYELLPEADCRAYFLACHYALNVAGLSHVEDDDRQVIIHAQRDRRSIHHF